MNFTKFFITLQQKLLANKRFLVILLQIATLVLAGLILLGGWLIYIGHPVAIEIMLLATDLGKYAIVCYFITLIPGIFRRFKITHPLLIILTTFRRQIGIFTYLLAFGHYFLMRGALQLKTGMIFAPPIFEVMGVTALLLLTPLFITSNDLSLKKLGKWWKKIHQLTYLALGLVLLHVILQRLSVWSIAAAVIFLAQIASGIYAWITKK